MSFRKSSVVIIDCGRQIVRAGRGVGEELLPAPSIEIRARVGLRKDSMQIDSNAGPRSKASDFLVGAALDEAEAAGEDLEIFWPFDDSQITLWPQAEAIWRYILFTSLQLRRTQNEYPLLLSLLPLISRSASEHIAQICFERLNVAGLAIFDRPLMQLYGANSMSGIVVDVGYGSTDITPIVEGEICSYGVMNVPIGIRHCELYLSYILRRLTNILYSLNTPTQLSPSDLDAAILALVRQAWSDGLIQPPFTEGASSSVIAASTDESAGMEDIAAILVAGKEKALIEAANARKNTTAQAKKAAASAAEKERAALDLVDVKFSFTPKSTPDLLEEKSITVTLGKERHQFCEPLFDPLLLLRLGSDVHHEDRTRVSNQSMGIPEAIRQAAAAVTLSNRTSVWSGIFLTGDASVKPLETALASRLTAFLSKDPENQMQTQPTSTKMLKIPEYFAEYRDMGSPIASFLGASIIGKLTFTDSSISKGYITKSDYAEHGPTAIRDVVG